MNNQVKGIFLRLCAVIVISIVTMLVMYLCTACNVTRTCTTESQYFHRGDTSVVIMTKTVETYDASKKQ